MTTIETPPPAAPEPAAPKHRSGFYVTPWVFAVLGGLALLVIGFVVGRAVDRRNHGGRPFFRGGDGGGAGHPALRLLILLVVIALVVWAVVALVRHFSHRDAAAAAALAATTAVPPAPATATTTAEQVLADRFARGEIDETEYVSRRNALRS